MNYIKSLKQQVTELEQRRAQAMLQCEAMLSHLHSAKFIGFEAEGRRKDWIATGDVIAWIQSFRSNLLP